MKLLHTSDWHLGRNLYGRKRVAEFRQFLDWLAATIITEEIDIICVAGDIFDNTTPGNTVQSLYFSFLRKLVNSCCRKIVIISGNHDSPSLLEAPRALLKEMNIEVIGRTNSINDEIIRVCDDSGKLAALICAVPFLRDQDIRSAAAGENSTEKQTKLLEGIRSHYDLVAKTAAEILAEQKQKIPIFGMGHLFAAGGKCMEGDGVRDLYVGTLVHVHSNDLPDLFDYLALGHLHRAQRVAGMENWRYSGSPLSMNFGESDQAKEVVIVEFTETITAIRALPVPCFQKLVSIAGNLRTILKSLEDLLLTNESVWLEIIYLGDKPPGILNEQLYEKVSGSNLEIIRIVNRRMVNGVLSAGSEEETLETLSIDDVFSRCMEQHEISEETQPELLSRFHEAISQVESGEADTEEDRQL